MLILALDTTTRSGSLALVTPDGVTHEVVGDGSITHGQRLPGDIHRLLDEARRTLDDVDLFAVAAGPGSFTGLRVGIAAVQGLAFATGKRVVPVSTLDALARAGAQERGEVINDALARAGARERGDLIKDARVVAWMDAQRGEVYSAVYDATGRVADGDAVSLPPGAALERIAARATGPWRVVGDGAVRYASLVTDALPGRATVVPHIPALARHVGAIAIERAAAAVPPHAIAPIYVRRPDVEVARDRRTAGVP